MPASLTDMPRTHGEESQDGRLLLPKVRLFCIGSVAIKQCVLLFIKLLCLSFDKYSFDNWCDASEGDSSQKNAYLKFYNLSKTLAST